MGFSLNPCPRKPGASYDVIYSIHSPGLPTLVLPFYAVAGQWGARALIALLASSSDPDYDALEADRARQRALLLSADLPQASPAAVESGAAEGVTDALSSLVGATVVETPSESSPPETSAALPKDGYWPDFRGPRRDGRYDDGPVLTDWPEDGLRQLWKHPIGHGYASFVVPDGRAFTIEQRRDHEVVLAYEVESGRELWTVSWSGEFVETMGGDGPRATPTYHEGRVCALGALGELRCLDAVTGHSLNPDLQRDPAQQTQ